MKNKPIKRVICALVFMMYVSLTIAMWHFVLTTFISSVYWGPILVASLMLMLIGIGVKTIKKDK